MSGRTSITLPGFASTRRELEPDTKVIVTISEDEDPLDISAVQRVLGDIDTGRLAANRWECTAAQATELAKLPRLAFFADYTVTDAEAGKVIGDAISASRATALATATQLLPGEIVEVPATPHTVEVHMTSTVGITVEVNFDDDAAYVDLDARVTARWSFTRGAAS